VKYGTYDRTDYTLEESFEALRADKNANRITQKTTLSFSNPGCYYFVAIAYDSNDKELLNESAAISIAEPFDMTQWTKIGTSKVVDGWVLGYALGFDESEYMQEVETYVKNDNNNVIGLYQPFKNEIYKDLQIPDSAEPLMITIDARDKDFIMIVPHNTHCGISNISIANAEGYFYWQGRSKEYTTKLLSAEDMTRIDDNNTITIPKSIAIIDGSAEYANPIYITLPADYKYSAVSNISVDNTDAPVEYYNLNGVRISSDNLVPGLYIRRQGNNVSKIAVK
jgi:hypothetical protein